MKNLFIALAFLFATSFAFANTVDYTDKLETTTVELSEKEALTSLTMLNNITVDIVIKKAEDGFSCSIEFTISNGSVSVSGTITADTCSEALQGLQLIASMMDK